MAGLIRGVAFAGATGAGKSSMTRTLAQMLSERQLSILLLRNDVLHVPGLKLWREAHSLSAVERFVADALTPAVVLAQLSAPDCSFAVYESWALNLLSEIGASPDGALARADPERRRAGIALVHLRLEDDEIVERSVRGPLTHRGPGWRRYLESLGSTEAEQAEVFRLRRRRIAASFALCGEPKIEISTTGMDWASYGAQILEAAGDLAR